MRPCGKHRKSWSGKAARLKTEIKKEQASERQKKPRANGK
jgi:hypothetical protein